ANVGRSQIAEGYFNKVAEEAGSAGIYAPVGRYQYPSDEIISIMAEENIDISHQKVKQLTKDMVEKAERIIILCRKSDCSVELRRNNKVVFREVEDPFGYGIEDLRQVRNKIKKIVMDLVKEDGTIML